MMLFPFIAAWMWFQIFTPSLLPSSGRPVENPSDADVSLLPAQVSFEGGLR